MYRITISLAAAVILTLVGGLPAEARGRSGGPAPHFSSMPSQHGMSSYHGMSNYHGMSSYHGMSNYHTPSSHTQYSFRSRPSYWYPRCWNSTYGCYSYWCPQSCCYYYWCQPYGCYYPVSYCPTGIYNYPQP